MPKNIERHAVPGYKTPNRYLVELHAGQRKDVPVGKPRRSKAQKLAKRQKAEHYRLQRFGV